LQKQTKSIATLHAILKNKSIAICGGLAILKRVFAVGIGIATTAILK